MQASHEPPAPGPHAPLHARALYALSETPGETRRETRAETRCETPGETLRETLPETLPDVVRRALQRLRESAAELGNDTILIDQLASLAGLSPRDLSRAFRESLGLRPLEVALLLRLDRSLGLLEHTRLPVAEVAALCGFLGAPHYLKVFWSAFSMTPFDYREACAEGRVVRSRSSSLSGLIAQRVLKTRP